MTLATKCKSSNNFGGDDAVGLAWVLLKNDKNLTHPLIRKR